MNNVFLNNKYTNYYYSIINNAIKREPLNQYTEKHHIIPRSLLGTNNKDNLVRLTPREHFICHLLLAKMTSGNSKQKMLHAANLLAQTRNVKINSYIYSKLKTEIAKVRSIMFKGKPTWNKGIPTPEFVKTKQSQARIGKEPWNKGKKCPTISIVRKERKLGWKKGESKSESTKAKMRKPKSPRHILLNRLSRFANGNAKLVSINTTLLQEILKETGLPEKYKQAGLKYINSLVNN